MRASRRIGVVLTDHTLSAGTNVVLTLFAARVLDLPALGRFGVVYGLCWFAQLLARAYCGDPLVLRGTTQPQHLAVMAGPALGAALVLGSALAIPAAATGLLRGELGTVALAVALPGVLLAEVVRSAAFAAGRPTVAVWVDAPWALSLVTALVASRGLVASPAGMVALWAIGANVGAAAGLWRGGWPVQVRPGVGWLRRMRRLGSSLLLEVALLAGFPHIYVIAIALLLGSDDAGAVRAALVLLGPSAVLVGGLLVAAQPEGLRALARWPGAQRRLRVVVVVVVGAIHPVAALLAVRTPGEWGPALVGGNWAETVDVLPWLGVLLGATAAGAALGVTYRWSDHPGRGAVVASSVTISALLGLVLATGSLEVRTATAAWAASAGFALAAGWSCRRGPRAQIRPDPTDGPGWIAPTPAVVP